MICNWPKFDFFTMMVVAIDLFFSFLLHPAQKKYANHLQKDTTKTQNVLAQMEVAPNDHDELNQYVLNNEIPSYRPS